MLKTFDQWQPARDWIAAELAVAVVLLALLPVVDRLGWVILVPAGLCAAAFAVRDLLLTPVLAADAEGMCVREGVRRVSAGWGQVQRLRIVRDRRTALLEIDLGDHVLVLSRRRLGTAPENVLAQLEQLRGGVS